MRTRIAPSSSAALHRSSVQLVALLFYFSFAAWSQSITGLAPFAPLQGSGAEIVNLANLNVHLTVPVMQKPGRGLDFHYALNYDSTIMVKTPANGTYHWA